MKFLSNKKNYYCVAEGASENPRAVEMKKINQFLSNLFSKAISYHENEGAGGGRHRSRSVSRQRLDHPQRPPSAPSQGKPPVIRIRRERSLNGVMWGSPQQLTSDSGATNNEPAVEQRRSRRKSKRSVGTDMKVPEIEKSTLKVEDARRMKSRSRESLNQSVSPEAERFVKAAISDIARPVERQVIRIINGNDPSIQSQVLLNTKTSQPWDDLVRDLGMTVKLIRGAREKKRSPKLYLETISGRKIQSYSQLRSELMAGTHAFYVYAPLTEELDDSLPSLAARLAPPSVQTVPQNRSRTTTKSHRHSLSVDNLPGVDKISNNNNNRKINVESELGKAPELPRINSTPRLLTNAATQEPPEPRKSKPSLIPVPNNRKHVQQALSREVSSMTELTLLLPSSRSNPNFQSQRNLVKKRESRKKRSEASAYLVSARSRSVSP